MWITSLDIWPHILKTLFFLPLNYVGIVVKSVRGYFWSLSSISLIHMSIFVLILYCLRDCSIVVSVLIKTVNPPTLQFFEIAVVILVPLTFQVNFKTNLSMSAKNNCNLDRDCVKSADRREVSPSWQLSFAIREHGMYFHLFRSTLISFKNVCF